MSGKNHIGSISLFFRLFRANKKKKAYTFLDLSIVVLVFSVLSVATFTITNSAMNDSKKDLTNERLTAIYEAIGKFVKENKRLPCPASITVAKADQSYGKESGDDCMSKADNGVYSSLDVRNIVYGMLPVNSLGLSQDFAEDAFGSKFSYVVNSHLTLQDGQIAKQEEEEVTKILQVEDLLAQSNSDSVDLRKGFGLYRNNSSESINITQEFSGNTIANIAFVVISHGANQNGAFSPVTSLQNSIATNQDDYYNVSRQREDNIGGGIGRATFGKIMKDKLHIIASNEGSDNFDDLVIFKKRSDILYDFHLTSLMPCIPNEEMQSKGFEIAYSGMMSQGVACPGSESIKPQKICGPLGYAWIDKQDCPTTVAAVESVEGEDMKAEIEVETELQVSTADVKDVEVRSSASIEENTMLSLNP